MLKERVSSFLWVVLYVILGVSAVVAIVWINYLSLEIRRPVAVVVALFIVVQAWRSHRNQVSRIEGEVQAIRDDLRRLIDRSR